VVAGAAGGEGRGFDLCGRRAAADDLQAAAERVHLHLEQHVEAGPAHRVAGLAVAHRGEVDKRVREGLHSDDEGDGAAQGRQTHS